MRNIPRRLPPVSTAVLTALAATAALATTSPAAQAAACLPSGTSASIQAALDATNSAVLCPGTTFTIDRPIQMRVAGQQLRTEGTPGSVRRAKLNVAAGLSQAIDASGTSRIVISNIEIDGGFRLGDPRPADRTALISAGGGTATDQEFSHNVLRNPRGWSALHLLEGTMAADRTPGCQRAVVTRNTIGPAGTDTGMWADGISLACGNSTVTYNSITDTTDGGIVAFGAKGSRIAHNTITQEGRALDLCR